MSFCERCGVELEAGLEVCPLCGGEEIAASQPHVLEYDQTADGVPARLLRKTASRAVDIVFGAAIVILLIADTAYDQTVTWSVPAIIPTAAGWLLIRTWLWARTAILGTALSLATITAMLALLDLRRGTLEWFIPVALPLVGTLALVMAVSWPLVRRARGAARIAIVLLAATAVTVGVDITVALWTDAARIISWSLVVVISTVPFAISLMLLQRTVLRLVDLRRRFHI